MQHSVRETAEFRIKRKIHCFLHLKFEEASGQLRGSNKDGNLELGGPGHRGLSACATFGYEQRPTNSSPKVHQSD